MSDNKDFKLKNLPKEFLEKFQALTKQFNLIPTAPQTPALVVPPVAKFGEGKLKDGTVVKWEGEQLVAGVPVMVVDPANPEGFLPAPDGEHELDNGMIIVVTEGKVTEVKQAAPAVPAVPDVTQTAQVAQMSAELKEIKENFAAVVKEKELSAEAFKKQFEDQAKKIVSIESTIKQVFELVGTMIETPSGNPIEPPVNLSNLTKKERLLHKLHN